MSSLLKKCKDFLGFDSEEMEDEDYMDQEVYDDDEEVGYRDEAKKSFFDSYEPEQEFDMPKSRRGNQRKSAKEDNVLSFNNNGGLKVVLCNPTEFDNCPNICSHLRDQMTIVLNLEFVQSVNERKRVFDFVSGCCYALDCNIQKVSDLIYVVAPYNVDLLAEVDVESNESFDSDYNYRASSI